MSYKTDLSFYYGNIKRVLKGINRIGTITISMLGYFTFSLISFDLDNEVYTIEIFENIEFCNVKKFVEYFELYDVNTRWFSNLVNNDTVVFSEFFENIGYEFFTHNVNSKIENLYYYFQGYINTKNVVMSSEISKKIKTKCTMNEIKKLDESTELIPTPELLNLMLAFKNIDTPLSHMECW